VWSAVIVFAGGGAGAIMRELFMLQLGRYSSAFPFDIFAANIVASFLLGLVFGLHRARLATGTLMLLVATGACGGMSTFSSFIYGAYSEMTTPGGFGISLLYIAASVVIGFGATLLGLRVADRRRPA